MYFANCRRANSRPMVPSDKSVSVEGSGTATGICLKVNWE